MLPLSDHNTWYYPSHGNDSDDEEANVSSAAGNWGNKATRGARWVRKGKIAPWGPGIDNWEVRRVSLINERLVYILHRQKNAQERR